ncbi:MAG: glycosyltransferase [Acidobacteria bacterium]|nr:glycosyltransferase [Acidobacteriota bacterium]
MNTSKVSVILPAYNQKDYVENAIRSVLDQTYGLLELIIVDDGSTDSTASIVPQFDDCRIRYIYQDNKGLPSARNTGINHSSGKYLAFLDADDVYHPAKLEAQTAFLDSAPDVGLCYHSRIEIDNQGNSLNFVKAPAEVGLKELLLGFPFSINDVLIRREWINTVGLFDETFVLNSEDRDFYLRLALAGCRFAGINRYLSCRRLYRGRSFANLTAKLDSMLRALETAFADPRCPQEAFAVRNRAFATVYLGWSYQCFIQDAVDQAQDCLCSAFRLDPSKYADPRNLARFLINCSIREGGEHENILRKIFSGIPREMPSLSGLCDWAVGRGYLLRGVRDLMWGRIKEGRANLERASATGARTDGLFLEDLTHNLLNYETLNGGDAAHEALRNIASNLADYGNQAGARKLYGRYWINQAFGNYHSGLFNKVPVNTFKAVWRDPALLTNRGVWSILVRSLAPPLRTRKRHLCST